MNTPRVLSIGMIGILFLGAVLSLEIFRVSHSASTLVTGLREISLPSVEKAHHIKGAIADMDAKVASGLANSKAINDEVLKRQSETIRNVINAAISAGGESEEHHILEELALSFTEYSNQISVAVSNSDIDAYFKASRAMHEKVFPLADQLIEINKARLSEGFENTSSSFQKLVLIAVFALLELALLVALQVYLMKKTRRFINVPLALSTVVLAVTFVAGMFISVSVHNKVVNASNHFLSIDNLWATRATYYDINGDTVRNYLRPNKQSIAKLIEKKDRIVQADLDSFNQISNQILKNEPVEETVTGYLLSTSWKKDEEVARKLIAASVRSLQEFLNQSIKILESTGKGERQAALEELVNQKDSGVNYKLNYLDELVGKAIYLNQENFEYSTKSAETYLEVVEIFGVVISALGALLAIFGINQRRCEFS